MAFGLVGPVVEGTCPAENSVCPASGERRGAVVRDRYLFGSCLPRAPFLAKSILMGKQWCWPQVVNWEGRGARKLGVLSAPVSKIFPTSPPSRVPATWHINPTEPSPQAQGRTGVQLEKEE